MAEQLVTAIDKRKRWIVDERQRLEAYAKAQAKKSCQCPKFEGTGVTRVVDTCSGCGGTGGVTLEADGVRKHLRMAGISQVSDSVWSRDLEGLFERVLMGLYWEGSEVSRKLTQELNGECLG